MGFTVFLIGVTLSRDNETGVKAWHIRAPWFDGMEVAHDDRMRGGGFPLAGLFSADEARAFHKRFLGRVCADGSIAPTNTPSEGTGSISMSLSRHPIVAEVDELLFADPSLYWVIIELWDQS